MNVRYDYNLYKKKKRLKASFIPGEGIPAQKRHPPLKNHLKVEQLLRNESTFITMNTSRRMEWATISQACHEVKKKWDQASLAERRSLDSCTRVCMNLE